MKDKKITICLIAVLMVNSALAATYYVFEEDGTIQAAIDACEDFDTVVIAPGTYRGSGNCGINFNGKAITVRSTDPTDPQIVNSTIIDCAGIARGFVFNTWEKADSKVAGLTIINGVAMVGGAIYSSNNSSPSITNCVIRNNSAFFGGGIACINGKSHPVITNCQIIANSASMIFGGGGIYLDGSSPTIKNCIISGNTAPEGGAIYSHNASNPLITNCTISTNTAYNSAGAIYCFNSSNLIISHSILWGNTAPSAPEILVGNLGAATTIQISYCDIQGGQTSVILDNDCTVDWGQGNIDIDPQFVDTGYTDKSRRDVEGDYHLLEESPCIDAGDSGFVAGPDETDIDGNPRILGEKIDLGADEYVFPIPAIVKIMPKTLNLQSNGNWISCTIQLPDEYSIYDIDTDTIALNKQIQPTWYKTDEGANKLLIKLDRSEIQDMLENAESPVLLRVAGKLNDGSDFAGTDTIRVLKQGQ
ncbi:MAG TPA: right-handed parallel beta-helix repeat-containing protein [Sedimentisphaerales bacterium]|nr:right-handed parallel beta-helix repeat-containing protein [Sedimentisphaerales bacterium]